MKHPTLTTTLVKRPKKRNKIPIALANQKLKRCLISMRKPNQADLQKLSPEMAMNDKASMFRCSTILSSASMKHLTQQIRHFTTILSLV